MKMEIQIAICDDEDKICLQLKDILGSISDEKSVEFIIQIFQCGEDLCKSLKDKDYDLIFLDIELPKINGIEVGKYIREKLNNEIVQIAYISAKTEEHKMPEAHRLSIRRFPRWKDDQTTRARGQQAINTTTRSQAKSRQPKLFQVI